MHCAWLQHPILTYFFFPIPRCPARERTGNNNKKTRAKDLVVVFILKREKGQQAASARGQPEVSAHQGQGQHSAHPTPSSKPRQPEVSRARAKLKAASASVIRSP